MDDLFVLAMFDSEGNFYKYVRKGRNNSIVGYDSLDSAKRGIRHTRRNNVIVTQLGYTIKIFEFRGVDGEEVVE